MIWEKKDTTQSHNEDVAKTEDDTKPKSTNYVKLRAYDITEITKIVFDEIYLYQVSSLEKIKLKI